MVAPEGFEPPTFWFVASSQAFAVLKSLQNHMFLYLFFIKSVTNLTKTKDATNQKLLNVYQITIILKDYEPFNCPCISS